MEGNNVQGREIEKLAGVVEKVSENVKALKELTDNKLRSMGELIGSNMKEIAVSTEKALKSADDKLLRIDQGMDYLKNQQGLLMLKTEFTTEHNRILKLFEDYKKETEEDIKALEIINAEANGKASAAKTISIIGIIIMAIGTIFSIYHLFH